eukprot:TRINITY_DN2813_c0_g1_i1.p1 TRINITY_DN2813_c0_g1~~TRINITY_DN2813_c0_g1_i1.p1  ORF type:complete len:203 (-),score=-24.63 TRINITY_DN2813_c0_g1_i1:122-730(-)
MIFFFKPYLMDYKLRNNHKFFFFLINIYIYIFIKYIKYIYFYSIFQLLQLIYTELLTNTLKSKYVHQFSNDHEFLSFSNLIQWITNSVYITNSFFFIQIIHIYYKIYILFIIDISQNTLILKYVIQFFNLISKYVEQFFNLTITQTILFFLQCHLGHLSHSLFPTSHKRFKKKIYLKEKKDTKQYKINQFIQNNYNSFSSIV